MHIASIRLSLASLVFTGLTLFAASSAQSATGTATVGQTVTFSVTADGTTPFSNQWCKNGVNIAGATAATFLISGVQLTDAGTYCVIVSNSAGSTTSDNAVLTVNPAAIAPVFTTQPVSQTVTVGASVTFTAAASGTPTPTYQWRKDSVNISGANGAAYTLSSVVTGNAGTYTVVATNSAGSAISSSAVLTVNPAAIAPVFTTQPVGQTVTVGASVTFTAAASGTPTPTYQWRKDSVNISGATSAAYTILSVVTGNAGTYTVVATNFAGSATSSGAVLTVNSAQSVPVFAVQPTSQTVTAGSSVTFSATASGSPTPTYQWWKNGRRIFGATSASYTIANVTTSNAGTYIVIATNSAGSATSNGAVLTVTTNAPKFTVQPAAWTVTVGASVSFTSAASGSPVPTYQWRKNGRRISGANSATYTISSVTTSSAGTYTVVATNPVGSATSNGAVLQVVSAASTVPVDFNLDGHSDILWQNIVTGEWSVSLMNGTTSIGVVSLGVISTDWSIAGIGDFNHDGNPDILARNTATGELSLWLMNGTAQSSVISLGVVSADWSVAGTGDFNGDGQTDILWQNTVTGELSVWLMNGTTRVNIVSLGVVGAGWSIAGTGDFNGDGHPDILWQNTVTTEGSIWLMNGTIQTNIISLGVLGTGWSIAGTGDFNGDGYPDILYQNTVTGAYGVMLMNGTTEASGVSLGAVSTDWRIRN
jgi:Immunoglobulin domain/FG-GAP-like repeat/Immunoglobulin I-set domain/FG-GAP repeat